MGVLRLDVVTIFPDYLRALNLSLVGRAVEDGLIDLAVHDLRSWARDRHRTVDDTPIGGGAGMVMRPDVWGRALDDVLAAPSGDAGRQILVLPTPSGDLFTQRTAEDLAQADRLVLACGRYEGIDARVAEHYRAAGIEVRELSIGDYVLGGGEAAALVMIEAIARLRPGVLGNPDSVVEESHGQEGLLEYPVYTRPVSWRGFDVAEQEPVLLSGDHARIARARRDAAIARTAVRRPDLIRRLRPERLDAADRAVLARSGWAVPPGAGGPVELAVRPARVEDIGPLAELAARTFPDACPPFLTSEQIEAHIKANLGPERFTAWQADPRAGLTVAELPGGLPLAPPGVDAGPERAIAPGELVGYCLILAESAESTRTAAPLDPGGSTGSPGTRLIGLDPRPDAVEVPERVDGAPGLAIELSKVYVDARMRSAGVAAALLDDAIVRAADLGGTVLWLGTSERNRRAHKAYRRRGFRRVGSRSYTVGGQACRDVVMSIDPREAGREH